MEKLFKGEVDVAGTTLILHDEQCGYSGRDGVIAHLEVRMHMGNEESSVYVTVRVLDEEGVGERVSLVSCI